MVSRVTDMNGMLLGTPYDKVYKKFKGAFKNKILY